MAKTSINVEMLRECSPSFFKEHASKWRKPLHIKNFDVGEAPRKWNSYYLSECLAEVPVKVHVSPNPKMNFIEKNFLYKTLEFSEFLKRTQKDIQDDFFICPQEKYYLRSLGNDSRKDVANITKQFPQLANDLKIPDFFDVDKLFSSIFRISSAGTQVWTHYDVMDNLLIQIVGLKKVTLFPPEDAKFLYMSGDKSQIVDLDNPDMTCYPLFQNATRYDCILEPGDIIFIPALWFHNTTALEFSISVNVFWKNLSHEMYDIKDVYGNKDPVVVQRAMLSLNKAIKTLDILPKQYKLFYKQSLLSQLQKSLDEERKKDKSISTYSTRRWTRYK